MKEMQIFENQEFGAVRTVELDGEPWLVGKDVAQALGYSNPRKALADHVDEEDKGVTKCDTLGGVQEMTIINESGLYSLVLSSKLPGAKKFRRWVTAEVLPAVRKHGAYMTPHTLEQALLSPDFLLRLAQRLKEEQEGRRVAERDRALLARELAVQQPKIDYFNELVERNLLLSLRETAKLLSVGEKAFIRWLLENRYLFRGKSGKLLPRQAAERGAGHGRGIQAEGAALRKGKKHPGFGGGRPNAGYPAGRLCGTRPEGEGAEGEVRRGHPGRDGEGHAAARRDRGSQPGGGAAVRVPPHHH